MIIHESFNSPSGYFYRARIRSDEKLPYSVNAHFHSSFELIYVLEGAFDITVNGLTETISTGESALFFPYEIHSFDFSRSEHFRFWLVTFSRNHVNSFSRMTENLHGSRLVFRFSPEVRDFLMKYLMAEEEAAVPLLIAKSGLYAVCSEYVDQIPLVKKSRVDSQHLVVRLSDYVAAHYAEKLSLDRTAKDLGYSYSYLSHTFSSLFDLSFSAYVNLYRVDRAEADLLTTDLPIVEIAEKNGFSSIRNFNYVFRNYKGLSPREFRKIGGGII